MCWNGEIFGEKVFFWSWKIGFFDKKIYFNIFFFDPKKWLNSAVKTSKQHYAVSKFLLLNLVTFLGQKKYVKINFFVKKPYFSRPKKKVFPENFTISTTFFFGGQIKIPYPRCICFVEFFVSPNKHISFLLFWVIHQINNI